MTRDEKIKNIKRKMQWLCKHLYYLAGELDALGAGTGYATFTVFTERADTGVPGYANVSTGARGAISSVSWDGGKSWDTGEPLWRD